MSAARRKIEPSLREKAVKFIEWRRISNSIVNVDLEFCDFFDKETEHRKEILDAFGEEYRRLRDEEEF